MRVNLNENEITVFGKGAKERLTPLGTMAEKYINRYNDKTISKRV